jgi:prevent-host-death family protein
MAANQGSSAIQVSADEVGRNWSVYLRRVEAGETLVITKAGKPVAEVKPSIPSSAQLRPYGLCAGEFTVPDDFDALLPPDIVADFEGQ